MITVRFPTGLVIEYEQATEFEYFANIITLYQKDKKGTRFAVAAVSGSAIVEKEAATRIIWYAVLPERLK